MSKKEMPAVTGNREGLKYSTMDIITESGLEIKFSREIPDVSLLSGKGFKIVSIQKELFDGDLDCVEVVTNFLPDEIKAIFHSFGFPVYDIEFNNKNNAVVAIGG